MFQGRYKSILVQADEYLHHLSRYIHLNPVRAQLVKEPEEYTWSSYKFFILGNNNPSWLTTDFILSCFDKDIRKAKGLYKRFVMEGIGQQPSETKENIKAGFILGNDDFVEWIKETFIKQRREDAEIPSLRLLKTKITPEEIKEKVEGQIKDEKLAKKLSIYLSRKYTDRKLKEIARIYGKMGDTGVSQVYLRVQRARESDKSLDKTIKKIEKTIMCNVET